MNTVVNPVAAGAAAAPRSFKDVWLISAGHAFTHWYTATFYLLLPLIGKELGLSYTEIGMIMAIQNGVGALSSIPGGMVVDMVGKKGYLMAISLFWVGFPYALMSLTHSYWMLLVCVTLVGIGNNIWHPTAIPTLAWQYPDRKGLVIAFHGMGGNIADGLAPVVVGALLAWMSWRTGVVVNVVPGLRWPVDPGNAGRADGELVALDQRRHVRGVKVYFRVSPACCAIAR